MLLEKRDKVKQFSRVAREFAGANAIRLSTMLELRNTSARVNRNAKGMITVAIEIGRTSSNKAASRQLTYSLVYRQYFTNIGNLLEHTRPWGRDIYPLVVAINGFFAVFFQPLYARLLKHERRIK